MANKRAVSRPHQSQPRSPARSDVREVDAVAREMAQLSEAERVKRWLRGMRAADELSQRLRAAGPGAAGIVARTAARPVVPAQAGARRAGRVVPRSPSGGEAAGERRSRGTARAKKARPSHSAGQTTRVSRST
jgi:hypothetical protein